MCTKASKEVQILDNLTFTFTSCILLLLSFQRTYTFMGFPLKSCALHFRKSITLFTLGLCLKFRSLKKLDQERFKEHLVSALRHVSEIFYDVDDQAGYWSKLMTEVLD